jgi:hypothetical protein
MKKRLKKLLSPLVAILRSKRDELHSRLIQEWLRRRWRSFRGKGANHGLPHPLIVSLTSYPARFDTLGDTLRCLLLQSVTADRVILWIDHSAIKKLPEDILAMRERGLEVRGTRDIRSYTKIIPTLREFPDAFIATADDDLYYPRDWLKELVEGWDGRPNLVVCHRAHEIPERSDNQFPLYRDWAWEVSAAKESHRLFPTGVGGVLYPPGVFSSDVLDEETFLSICARADDVWLYWMGRRNGSTIKRVGKLTRIINWPSSQATALYHGNVMDQGNDVQIAKMIERYGVPFETTMTGANFTQ